MKNEGALTVWSVKDLLTVWRKDLADFKENQEWIVCIRALGNYLTHRKKSSWFDRFTLLMGKRQKRRLKLIRKLHKLPIFSLGVIKLGNPKRAKWVDLVHSTIQSALRIRFLLPTGAVTFVTCTIITWPYGSKENQNESRSGKTVQPPTHTVILYFPTRGLQ